MKKGKCDLCGYETEVKWFQKFKTYVGQSFFDVNVCQLCQNVEGQYSVLIYCTNLILDEIKNQAKLTQRQIADYAYFFVDKHKELNDRLAAIEKKLDKSGCHHCYEAGHDDGYQKGFEKGRKAQ